MYDFNVTVKTTSLYEVIGTKTVTKHDQREGAYESRVNSVTRCATFDEVVQYIRLNPDMDVQQVVEIKDVTIRAKNQSRDTVGCKD